MSQETKDKISRANKGKKRTPEQCAHLSSIRKGKKRKPHSKATIERIRQSNMGKKKRKWTDEERAAQSERVKAQWEDPMRRLKQSAARKRRKSQPK